MTWLLWRQHRRQGMVSLALLGALGILLWITGVHMAHVLHQSVESCGSSPVCNNGDLFQGYQALFDLVDFTVLVPPLVGVFWGVTFVGRELDTGTNRLVWTQSVTRRHWLTMKVLLLLAGSAVVGALLTALVTWWSGTPNAYNHDRFGGIKFDTQGVVPLAYTVFAATLALACGVLWRRTLPALATAFGAFFAVRLAIESFVRPHFQAAKTLISAIGSSQHPAGAWILSSDPQLNGHALPSGKLSLPQACAAALDRKATGQCLTKFGYHEVTRFQPAARYWHFQYMEASIFVVLSALLVLVAVVALRRQDA